MVGMNTPLDEFRKEFGGIWVAEYSSMQDAYHIQTLDAAIVSNIQLLSDSDGNGYVPIHASRSRMDVDLLINEMAKLREKNAAKIEEHRLLQKAIRGG